ncbi:PAS domain S-box protein [Leptospira wolffii]|uniref:Chemotaxis protein n=1 Tax=Leptospira wolffii TaxID=409998 RepID=A0A2M9ZES4_9LEPT|nr:methyl-accepting chemotaxis protein [Leptospira wolffii]EPG65502.1 PAS domain S-box protein [Leptospira wolffii serovar Khorat str. Khorat-H2]PJZ66929.1 chemotaxis protein [Leptospira wolffii]TGK61902.1 PAS domain S-box protein [Leptospira wolffii]TGK68503.1 PAS domain S-box protein [Leptospira wolffii]TGK74714.1 PAS domain S-box protein [Leptospira wolffii]
MRKNLPVTGREIQFGDSAVIISRTDAKGRITYVSKDFAEISGYSEEEMMGEPHNIVRHPDVPPVVFKDLWDTIQSGRPWNGVVKNRAKSGDHYWVDATVTPVLENGIITGYMSVRKKAARKHIETAEKLFSSLNGKMQIGFYISSLAKAVAAKIGFFQLALLHLAFILLPLGFLILKFFSIDPVLATACLIFVSIGTAFLLSSLISQRRRTQEVTEIVRNVVNGNFILDIPRTEGVDDLDKIYSNFRCLTISLWGLLVQMKENFSRNLRLYEELFKSVNTFQTGSQKQATSVEETAAASHELSRTIDEIVLTISEQTRSLSNVTNSIGAIDSSLSETSISMDDLESQAGNVAGKASEAERTFNDAIRSMEEIRSFSNQINKIVGIITSISDRTNMLALNASIESARAGEAGKGFSVVADEISKLAEQTKQSIKDIVQLVKNTSDSVEAGAVKVNQSVDLFKNLQDYIEKVHSSSFKVKNLLSEQSKKLGEIRSNSNQVLELGKMMTNSSEMQKVAANEISDSMSLISKSAEEIALASDTIKISVEDTLDHSQKFGGILSHFKTGS